MNFSKKNHEFKNKNVNAMSKTVKTILVILVLGLILTVVSCKDAKKEDATTKTEQVEKKEFASAYVCPMHCEGSGSDKKGECPKCGMDYVKNEDFKGEATIKTEQAEKKEHDSHYVCPMRCEGSGSDKEGECPKCGMDYVKNEEHTKNGHEH